MVQKRSFLIHTLNSTLAITRHSRAYPSGVRTARWGFSRAPCLTWIWQNPLAATGAGEPQLAHRQRSGWSCCTTQPDAARLLEQMFEVDPIGWFSRTSRAACGAAGEHKLLIQFWDLR